MGDNWLEQASKRKSSAVEDHDDDRDPVEGSKAEDAESTTPLRPVTDDGEPVSPRALPPKKDKKRAGKPKKRKTETSDHDRRWASLRTLALVIGGLSLGTAAVVGSVIALTTRGGDTELPPTATSMTQSSLDTADEVGYAGQCSSGEEGTVVKASREGLRETIVAFETAYYERDVDALLATVSANSGLAATEWEEVLPEAAPDDTSWCVVMQPEVDGVVDIDLEVTSPDGEVTTFRQRVAGEKVPGSSQWRIKKIDAQP